jgi:hypothetical protein
MIIIYVKYQRYYFHIYYYYYYNNIRIGKNKNKKTKIYNLKSKINIYYQRYIKLLILQNNPTTKMSNSTKTIYVCIYEYIARFFICFLF